MNVLTPSDALQPGRFAVGQPVSRLEDPVLLRGEGRYSDDISLPGQLYGVMVRSRNAHGIIRSIDTAAAKAMPGVRAVLTAADLQAAGIKPMPANVTGANFDGRPIPKPPQWALATDRVRYVGHPIAIVVAETHMQAKDAAEAVFAEIDTLPAVTTAVQAAAAGAPAIYDEAPDNVVLDWKFGDAAAVEAAFATHGGEIACVIVEAAAANMGVIPPREGFNALLRDLTARHGALLVLDEVLTGFRVGPAGWWGLEGVTPDLFTFGKVMSGGLPAAAFGGRSDVMSSLAPAGPVYQAGTLSGNPVAVAAGIAQLTHCTDDVYARVDEASLQLSSEVAKTLEGVGVPYRLNRAGNLFSVFFTDTDVVDFASASTTSSKRYAAFFHAMLERGVYLPPSAYEAWFLSAAHDDAAIDRILDALPHAAAAAAEAAR